MKLSKRLRWLITNKIDFYDRLYSYRAKYCNLKLCEAVGKWHSLKSNSQKIVIGYRFGLWGEIPQPSEKVAERLNSSQVEIEMIEFDGLKNILAMLEIKP